MIDESSKVSRNMQRGNSSGEYPHHHDERSPLLPDDGGALIVKRSSRDVRVELRDMSFSASSNVVVVDPSTAFSVNTSEMTQLEQNGSWPHWLTISFTVSAVLISGILSHSDNEIDNNSTMTKVVLILLTCVMVLCGVLLSRLPQAAPPETFTCPLVPIVPLMGILCNSYMMGSMPLSTWSAICMWLFAGVCFYFCYGMHHSELRGKK